MHFRIATTIAIYRAHRLGKITDTDQENYFKFLAIGTPPQWTTLQGKVAGRVQTAGKGKVGTIDWASILTFLQGLVPLIMQIIDQFLHITPTPAPSAALRRKLVASRFPASTSSAQGAKFKGKRRKGC
jgi:hypothetical protein